MNSPPRPEAVSHNLGEASLRCSVCMSRQIKAIGDFGAQHGRERRKCPSAAPHRPPLPLSVDSGGNNSNAAADGPFEILSILTILTMGDRVSAPSGASSSERASGQKSLARRTRFIIGQVEACQVPKYPNRFTIQSRVAIKVAA